MRDSIAVAIAVAAIVATATSACRKRSYETSPPRPALREETVSPQVSDLNFLTAELDPPGWAPSNPPRVISSAQIDDYLDLDASHLQSYRLIALSVGQYESPDGKGWATVEIFRFPDNLGAFGAYSTRRTAVRSFLRIGDEAFEGQRGIYIWRGSRYIRIFGVSSANELQTLAATVTAPMPGATSKPHTLALLPDSWRVVNSETWRIDTGFDQPYLAPAFTADYAVGGKDKAQGMIMMGESPDVAAKALEQFRELFVRGGKVFDAIPDLGDENFRAEDRTFGRAVVFRRQNYLVAFRGFGGAEGLISLAWQSDQLLKTELQSMPLQTP